MSYDALVLKLRRRAQGTRHTTSDLLRQAADAVDSLERQNHDLRRRIAHSENAPLEVRVVKEEPYYATGQPFPHRDTYWGKDGE